MCASQARKAILELDAMRAAAATAKEPQSAPGADDAAALKKLAKQAGEAAQLLKMLGQ